MGMRLGVEAESFFTVIVFKLSNPFLLSDLLSDRSGVEGCSGVGLNWGADWGPGWDAGCGRGREGGAAPCAGGVGVGPPCRGLGALAPGALALGAGATLRSCLASAGSPGIVTTALQWPQRT